MLELSVKDKSAKVWISANGGQQRRDPIRHKSSDDRIELCGTHKGKPKANSARVGMSVTGC
jgi:hypothetical protein